MHIRVRVADHLDALCHAFLRLISQHAGVYGYPQRRAPMVGIRLQDSFDSYANLSRILLENISCYLSSVSYGTA